jgi:hypothetical protein
MDNPAIRFTWMVGLLLIRRVVGPEPLVVEGLYLEVHGCPTEEAFHSESGAVFKLTNDV